MRGVAQRWLGFPNSASEDPGRTDQAEQLELKDDVCLGAELRTERKEVEHKGKDAELHRPGVTPAPH